MSRNRRLGSGTAAEGVMEKVPVPKPEEKRDEAADMKAINFLRSQMIAAFNSNDPAVIAATYTDDAIVMPTNQTAVEGKQAIQAYYAARFKQNPAEIALKVLVPLRPSIALRHEIVGSTGCTGVERRSSGMGIRQR
jgi:uncharacterized protein (TIGR02246 family)